MFDAFSNLLPAPLHPAVVHLPMALAVLVPVFAAATLIAIHRGARPLRAWAITTAMLAALSVSAWVSLETGEGQEDKVEAVVGKSAIETHAAAAEAFLVLSLVVLGIAAVGLANGKLGTAARVVASVGTVALLVSGFRVGRAGGELVYKYGAARAYAGPSAVLDDDTATESTRPARRERHDR